MDTIVKPESTHRNSNERNSITATNLQSRRILNKGFINTSKMLLRILGILLVAYLAFFSYVAIHEWVGHILADTLVYAHHGTYINALDVRVQWLAITMQDGHWKAALGSFQFGGSTWASSHDPYSLTKWETGFSNLMGSGMTTLVALVALIVLNLRKNKCCFPWFTASFVLWIVIFDQIFYTFAGSDPEPLVSAILMGVNPFLFKGIVIGLIVLEVCLLVDYVIRYRRSRQAPPLSTS
jgi:hypothetical protein